MLFAQHLAAFYFAFSTKTHCIQHHFTLHFVPKRTAFSGILHCVQHQNALHFAANHSKTGVGGRLFKYIFILPACTTNPFLHQNKPSRESIFCGKVSGWWTKKPLFVLKFLPKTIQNDCAAYMCMGNGTEDPQAYNRQRKRMQGMQLMANGAASWKRRSNLDFGSVLFSVKVFFGLSVTPYSFTPYYLLFGVKVFFGLPVTPLLLTTYCLA